jgi:hypothetical protein
MTDRDHDAYAHLQQYFGDLLRHGAIDIDSEALERLADSGPRDELRAVLATPGSPATGLARHLDRWRRMGSVSIPASEETAFDRWFDLEQRSSADYQTIVVEQPGTAAGRAC